MTFIKYDKTKPFNTTLVEFKDEMSAMLQGEYIRCGEFEINLIKSREACWFNHQFRLIRDARKILLNAFDIYSKNVAYGLVEETQEKHSEILSWYKKLLDLKEEAFINIPQEIEKHI